MSEPSIRPESLTVASPCPEDWSRMEGDEKRRYCGRCQLHVYNLSAMTTAEAAELVEKGKLRKKTIDLLVKSLDMSRVMIELPGPWISDVRSCDIEDMKKALVRELGSDVNLANVPPASIIDTAFCTTELVTPMPSSMRRWSSAAARIPPCRNWPEICRASSWP